MDFSINHLLEVGLTQNWETMALRMLTIVDLLYIILYYHIIMLIHWNNICLRARSYTTSHYTWGSVTTLHDFKDVVGQPLDTFFGALTISWSRLLARVWSGPKVRVISCLHILLILFYCWVRLTSGCSRQTIVRNDMENCTKMTLSKLQFHRMS